MSFLKIFLKKERNLLFVIIASAVFVRFFGLNWAFPYAPHPDEWNMARAIAQLNWQDRLNPHFFAYGQFPLYLAYFSTIIYNLIPWIKINSINVQEAIFFLRFWSALAGIGTVYLVYLVSRRLFTVRCSLFAALLAAFTPGLIQISHFGTTESLLSFFFLLIIFLSLKILEKPKKIYYISCGIVLGLALGTKISALIFGFPVFLVFFIQLVKTLKNKNKIINIAKLLTNNLIFFTLTLTLTLISSPYLILAFKESRGTLLYETSIATGQSSVFYTRQFLNTTPILFQLQKIFPYALGWPMFILGFIGFILSLVSLKFPKSLNTKYLPCSPRSEAGRQAGLSMLNTSFAVYFLSQAFLFTKWTRFLAPIFAFFPIFAGIFLSYLKNLRYLLIAIAVIPGVLFFTVYFLPDIRFTASEWIYKNIPSGSQILFDSGNVVDIPLQTPGNYLLSSVSFDFYHLDENPDLFLGLIKILENSDYIIVPSRRVFYNHLRLEEKYPLTARYYKLLFSGGLGFVPVAKIEPFYSKIFKDEKAEETFTVFDHPTIRIYQKNNYLNNFQYENLFQK